jgi:hypothetical protein
VQQGAKCANTVLELNKYEATSDGIMKREKFSKKNETAMASDVPSQD